MNTISTFITVTHQDTNQSFQLSSSRDAAEATFSSNSVEVTSTSELIDISAFTAVRHILIRLLSGDDLLIGDDNTNWPYKLSGANDFICLRLDDASPPTTYIKSAVASSQVLIVIVPE